MFQLVNPTAVLLKHINLHQEKHGKTKVDSLDFNFVLKGDHTLLSLLDERLPAALYYDPDAESQQQVVDGLAPIPHKPRFPRISQIPWPMEGTGFDMSFHYGIDGEVTPIEFGGGKASVKRVELEGTIVTIFCRYSTTDIPDGAFDKLRTKVDRGTIDVTLVHNEQLREAFGGEAIDGSTAAFERDHPLFDQAGGGDDEPGDGDDGDPEETDVTMGDGEPATLTKRRGGRKSKPDATDEWVARNQAAGAH